MENSANSNPVPNTAFNDTANQMFALADLLKQKKDEKKALEKQTTMVNAEIEALDRQLSDAMTEAECLKFSHGGNTFYLNSRLFAGPKEGMRDEMIKALRKHGYGAIVTETVNANTLASFCKERMIEEAEAAQAVPTAQVESTEGNAGVAEQLPAWLSSVVNTYEKVTVGIRKV